MDEQPSTAAEHRVEPCADCAVGPDRRPFARGPPLPVPATREEALPANPEPAPADTSELERSRREAVTQLNRITPTRRQPQRGDLDPALADTRDQRTRELDERVQQLHRDRSPKQIEAPELTLSGTADPARAQTDRTEFEADTRQRRDEHRQMAEEDFGEDRLAPQPDPTPEPEAERDVPSLAQIEAAPRVEDAQLDRIATDDNVGRVNLDQLVVAPDRDLDALRQTAEAEAQTRALADRSVVENDRLMAENCRNRCGEEDREIATAQEEVTRRRKRWLEDTDRHVARRTQEGQQLVDRQARKAERLHRDAKAEAHRTVADARATAASRWQEARQRARQKVRQSEDRSWWELGLDWVSAQLNRLSRWIEGFLEGCRQAIDALLDAAADRAHRIIENAHTAIGGTLDLLRRGLDLIADKLPGELGEIARSHQDGIHQVLDSAQTHLDGLAAASHQFIDEAKSGLRDRLQGFVDTLAEGHRYVAGVIEGFSKEGLMSILRRLFPGLANLIDRGLQWVIDWAAGSLTNWLEALLERSRLRQVEEALEELQDERFCQQATPEEQAEACADFERKLQDVMTWSDELLEGDQAQSLRAEIQRFSSEQAEEELGAVHVFFTYIQEKATTVFEWWQSIQDTIERVRTTYECMAATLWRHIATFLGIDVNLDPLEAISTALENLWQTVVEGLQSAIDAIREAWRWLREESFLAPLFDFFDRLSELWSQLGQLWDHVTTAAWDWLVESAEWLANTLLRGLDAVLAPVSRLMHRIVDGLATWADGLVELLDRLLSWEVDLEPLRALANVLKSFVRPIRTFVRLYTNCILMAWRWAANNVRNLLHYVRVFFDICTGVVQAILLGIPGIVGFFAGRIWLHLIPDCYKAAILNFLFDLFIRLVTFIPEPEDFMLATLYRGALEFLVTLRKAPDEQKIKAVEPVASLLAGNTELALGFLVGLGEGIWESTGGTIMFINQAVWWLTTLPVRLVFWSQSLALGAVQRLVTGGGSEGGETAGEAPVSEEEAAPESAAGPAEAVEGPEETTEAIDAEEAFEPEIEQAVEVVDETAEESASEAAEAEEEPEPTAAAGVAGEEGGPGATETEAGPVAEVESVGAEPSEAEAAGEVTPASASGPEPETTGGGSETEAEPERPPQAPTDLPSLGQAALRLINEGFSREDLRQLLDSARAMLAGMVGKMAREAAQALLDTLTSTGIPFSRIGRVLGTVVGMLVVEAVLAYLTAGGSGVIAAARTSLFGARGALTATRGASAAARAPSLLSRLFSRIRPILDDVVRLLRRAARGLISKLRQWFDDVLKWMRGILDRLGPVGRWLRRLLKKAGKMFSKAGKWIRKQLGKVFKKAYLKLVARRAARKGWEKARRVSKNRMISRRQMQEHLRTVRVNSRPGVRVQLNIRHAMRGQWKVRAVARQGARRKTAKEGGGWRAKDLQRQWWYTTAGNQDEVHFQRAVRAIRPKLRRTLRDGVSEDVLEDKLRRWRRQYDLRVLLLRSNGEIYAAASPGRVVERARQLPSQELGRLLKPLLERAAAHYRASLYANEESRERINAAVNELRNFRRLSPAGRNALQRRLCELPRGELSEVFAQSPVPLRDFLRELGLSVNICGVPVQQAHEWYLRRALRGQRDRYGRMPPLGGVLAAGQRRTGYYYSRSAGTYVGFPSGMSGRYPEVTRELEQSGISEAALSEFLAAPRQNQTGIMQRLAQGGLGQRGRGLLRSLTILDDLERGRMMDQAEGITVLMSRQLGQAGELSIFEQQGGEYWERQRGGVGGFRQRIQPGLSRVTQQGAQTENIDLSVDEAIGELFQRLERAASRAEIYKQPGGQQLRKLAESVDRWLAAREPTSPADLRQMESQLVRDFVAFLESFD